MRRGTGRPRTTKDQDPCSLLQGYSMHGTGENGQRQGWTPPLVSGVSLPFLALRFCFFSPFFPFRWWGSPEDPSPARPMRKEINHGPAPSCLPISACPSMLQSGAGGCHVRMASWSHAIGLFLHFSFFPFFPEWRSGGRADRQTADLVEEGTLEGQRQGGGHNVAQLEFSDSSPSEGDGTMTVIMWSTNDDGGLDGMSRLCL